MCAFIYIYICVCRFFLTVKFYLALILRKNFSLGREGTRLRWHYCQLRVPRPLPSSLSAVAQQSAEPCKLSCVIQSWKQEPFLLTAVTVNCFCEKGLSYFTCILELLEWDLRKHQSYVCCKAAMGQSAHLNDGLFYVRGFILEITKFYVWFSNLGICRNDVFSAIFGQLHF